MRHDDQMASRRQARSDGSLTKADYEALAAYRHAMRSFAAFSEQAARAAGLTPQQHQALLAVKGAPGRSSLTVGEIATALMIRPHSAAELVDRLAQLDLACRAADPADHRRVQVQLTLKAEALLHDLSRAHLRELREIRPTLEALIRRFAKEE
jgi:DNA-binding MarR family transcriptional regulator